MDDSSPLHQLLNKDPLAVQVQPAGYDYDDEDRHPQQQSPVTNGQQQQQQQASSQHRSGVGGRSGAAAAALLRRIMPGNSSSNSKTAAGGDGSGSGSCCCRLGRCGRCVRSNLLTLLTMSSVVAGIVLGLALRTREAPWTHREIMYVTFPGDLFLRMLKCLILPLIVSSMVAALGGLDLAVSGRIGTRAIVYYMGTTFLAVVLGIVLVSVIHPGEGNPDEIARAGDSRNVTTVDTLLDLVRNMFPPNIVEACISQYRTLLIYPGEPTAGNDTLNGTDSITTTTTVAPLNENNVTDITAGRPDFLSWKIKGENSEGTNILGLVVFSIVLGITISYMREAGRPLYQLFHTLGEAMMLITGWVIWLSPIGILFLVSGKMLEMSSFAVIIGQLGMYFLTVMVGLFVHGFVVIPLCYSVVTRRLPFRFCFNMLEALITAFGTSSSSATLPITIRCLEDKNGVDRRVARFVIPIGATINMDGTALYEAVAAIFIAQVRQVPLDVGKIVAVSITATAASIGAAGIPQAGLVTMVMVLNAVGLPAEDVTLIIVVDWLLDRFRTLINVLGDSVGAGIVQHLSRDELKNYPDPDAVGPATAAQPPNDMMPLDDVHSTNHQHRSGSLQQQQHQERNGDAKCDHCQQASAM